jgi:hypothetical protein
MGACQSNNKVKVKSSNTTTNDEHSTIRAEFQKLLKNNPFYNLSILQQATLDNDFNSSNKTPTDFITGSNKYSASTKRLYSLCYSKCEPSLNNITNDNKKLADSLFFNISLFMLTIPGVDEDRKRAKAMEIINQAYDDAQKKTCLKKLEDIIQESINIALQVLIYLICVFLYIRKEDEQNLAKDDVLIEGRFELWGLDKYFFDKFKAVNGDKEYFNYIDLWVRFIMMPIDGNREKTFIVLTDKLKASLVKRLVFMFDPSNFFESLLKFSVNFMEK